MNRKWPQRFAGAFRRHIRYRITRSGYLFAAALLLVGAGAILSANNLLFLVLAAMLATLLISDVVSRLSLAGLGLELLLPEHIAARQITSARLRVRNTKWIPSFAIHLTGREASGPSILQQKIVLPVLPGRAVSVASAPVLFPRRGLHRENLFSISTRFPFGFVDRRVMVSIQSEVLIYPALEPSVAAEELVQEIRGEIEREQRGQSADFYRLRPYEAYESARHLDWRSSAHTGELQVREYAREERSAVYFFIDLQGKTGAPFEAALECCAWVIWSLRSQPVRIRLGTQEADLEFPEGADIYDLLRVLALAQPANHAPVPRRERCDPDVLYSADPDRFVQAGWRPARVIRPEQIEEFYSE